MIKVMRYLPCGCISPEIGKLSCKPVVDLVESQLSVRGLQNGLSMRGMGQKLGGDVDGRDGEECRFGDLHDV